MRVWYPLPFDFSQVSTSVSKRDIDAFLWLRHLELGTPPEVGISFRDVRIVEGLVRYRLNGPERSLERLIVRLPFLDVGLAGRNQPMRPRRRVCTTARTTRGPSDP